MEQERATKFRLGGQSMKNLWLVFWIIYLIGRVCHGQGAPVSVTNKSLPVSITAGSVVVVSTPQYGLNTPVPVSIQTPVPQFTQIPYPTAAPQFTQLPFPTPVYPLNTPQPVIIETPVPQFTQVFPYPTNQGVTFFGTPQVSVLLQDGAGSTISSTTHSLNVNVTNGITPVFPYPTSQIVYPNDLAVTALPAAVTSGQTQGFLADLFGRLFIFPYGPRQQQGSFNAAFTIGGSSVTFISAVAATYNDLMPNVTVQMSGPGGFSLINGTVTISGQQTGTGFASSVIFPGWFFEKAVNLPWVIATSGTSNTGIISGEYQANQ